MNPLKSNDIYGIWATILLPIEKDDSINYEKLEEEIDYLITSGVNGIYTNGTASEFYNQTEDEFDRISELVADKCGKADMPFQIGCSHMSPIISLERIKRILPLKPGAIQVILPDWYPPSMPEIIDFLRLLSDIAAPIGLVLYNPGHAKRKLSPHDFNTILNREINLIGCKVGGGDENWYRDMKKLNPDLSLFIPGHKLAGGLRMGAAGSYSNVACLNPRAAQSWYRLMHEDMPAALELEQRIQTFIIKYIIPYITERGYSDSAVDKFMASIGSWGSISTRLRWPYRGIDENEAEKIRVAGRDLLPEFF